MNVNSVFFENHLAQTTMFPFALEIVSADGVYLTDASGKKYMDMVSGIGVSGLGHGNKYITDAIKAQLDKHMHVMVYGEFVQQAQIKAATLLTSLLPPSLDCCYFVNSGTEANEAALKLAKRITGRSKIISFRGAYHGSTHGSLSVSGNEKKKYAFRPLLPDVHFIRFGNLADLQHIDKGTACVIMETIQGDAGVRIPTIEYMQALRQQCYDTGTVLILDEIQCGLGRAGTMFAFEQFSIVPDILTLGKALGGGMPVGCMVSSKEKMQQLTFDPMLGHISTFAGHPVVCAAVAANLEYMVKQGTIKEVEEKGTYIAAKIGKHARVKEIRQRGLFFAIDLDSMETVQRVVDYCLDKGLISFWFLSCPDSFRIAPPLTISYEEMDKASSIILNALDAA
jgi:acetylornithine/succinyldiaminopimelate/putrescine aminotransferase